MPRRALLLAMVTAIALGLPAPPAAAEGRTNPVLYLHGLNPIGSFGYPCSWSWGQMERALRGWGWTGALDSLGFYALDSRCDDRIDHHGSHDRHVGNNNWWQPARYNHSWLDGTSHSADTPLEHLGYHFAWYVYDHYTSRGRSVDMVAHSMGGLIVRYALTKVQEHHVDFPPALRVEDVVTLETPHAGTSLSWFCGWTAQCRELEPGSDFLRSLGWDPQVTGGTDWTAVGSYFDPLVGEESAVAMGAAHRVKYVRPRYDHLFPLYDTTDRRDAVLVRSENGGAWIRQGDQAHSVRLTDLGLATADE